MFFLGEDREVREMVPLPSHARPLRPLCQDMSASPPAPSQP